MLPFLDGKRLGTILISRRKSAATPSETLNSTEDSESNESMSKDLMNAAHDLISAVQANDVKGVAAALEDAWAVCESYEPEAGE